MRPSDTALRHWLTRTVAQAAAAPQGAGEPTKDSTKAGDTAAQTEPVRTDSGTLMRLTIEELLILAPRLRTYLTTPRPVWRDIVDAADWLRGEMGISRPLWGEACLAMGRECAAVAVGLVSAKPAEHFRTSPGGYFHGNGGQGQSRRAQLGADHLGAAAGEGRQAAWNTGRGSGVGSATVDALRIRREINAPCQWKLCRSMA